MGYALAEAALAEGHDVTLISGPVNLEAPQNIKLISVSTSDEMFEAVHRHADQCDICVLCAAVADYKPAISNGLLRLTKQIGSCDLGR